MELLQEQNSILDFSKFQEFNQTIKNTTLNIEKNIAPNQDYIKVILMGLTGAGKSTLACILANTGLIAKKGPGGKIILEGIGVKSGCTSVTKDPIFTVDKNMEIVFIDCAGFEDTKGFEQEMINAFAMNSLFENRAGIVNQFKVLLVISDPEIESGRGQSILNSLKRLESLFPDHDQLKNAIGLVISKSNPEIDYIEMLEDGASPKLLEWCNHFKQHRQNVFIFPKPEKKDLDKQFDFEDHERLNLFLKTDLMINPVHKISINENSLLEVKNLKLSHLQNTIEKIRDLCNKINEQFRNEKDRVEVCKWIDIMYELANKRIRNANDFANVIKNNIPKSQMYEKDFSSLAEFEMFDSFIYQVLGESANNDSCLSEAISSWTMQAIMELQNNKEHLIEAELQRKMNDEITKKLDNETTARNNLQDQLTKATTLQNNMKAQLDNVTADRTKLIDQLNKAATLQANIQNQLKNAEVDRNKLQDQLNTQMKNAEADRNKLQNQLNTQMKNAEADRNKLQNQLNTQLKNAEADRNKLQNQLETQLKKAEENRTKLQDQLNNQLKNAEADKNRLQNQLTAQIRNAEADRNKLRDQLIKKMEEEKRNQNQEAQRKLDELTARYKAQIDELKRNQPRVVHVHRNGCNIA